MSPTCRGGWSRRSGVEGRLREVTLIGPGRTRILGGRVAVTTARDGDEAVLTVADTGVGIAEADLPLLFRRFYRADPARSREHGGSGLGLAICRSIVEARGRRIDVDSRPGAGTTVTVRLPAAEDRSAGPRA